MRLTAIQTAAASERYRQTLDPTRCVIDIIQLFEVLRLQMVSGCEAVWEVVENGALRISFPATVEAEMIIPASQWRLDAAKRQKSHLRLV